MSYIIDIIIIALLLFAHTYIQSYIYNYYDNILYILNQVVDLVNEAAKDINFYMQKAPLFDYTIINTSDEYENAIAELKDLFQNLR